MGHITLRNPSLIPSLLRPLDRVKVEGRAEDGDVEEAVGAGGRKRGRRMSLPLANLVASVCWAQVLTLGGTDDEEVEVVEGEELPPGDIATLRANEVLVCYIIPTLTCAKPLRQVVPVFDC